MLVSKILRRAIRRQEQIMAEETETDKISLEELMVSTLARPMLRLSFLVAKGVFTDDEFKA